MTDNVSRHVGLRYDAAVPPSPIALDKQGLLARIRYAAGYGLSRRQSAYHGVGYAWAGRAHGIEFHPSIHGTHPPDESLFATLAAVLSAESSPPRRLCWMLMMTDLNPGDLVIAVPISDCRFGHPNWHSDFAHPEMDLRTYLVTWTGRSSHWKRPVVAVAGKRGHFCAGCFTKQRPQERHAIAKSGRTLVNA